MTFVEAIDTEINRTKHDAFMLTERIKALEALRDVYSNEKPLTLSGNMVEIPLKTEQNPRFTLAHMNPELETQLWEGVKKGEIYSAIVDEQFGGIVAYGTRPMVDHLLERLN